LTDDTNKFTLQEGNSRNENGVRRVEYIVQPANVNQETVPNSAYIYIDYTGDTEYRKQVSLYQNANSGPCGCKTVNIIGDNSSLTCEGGEFIFTANTTTKSITIEPNTDTLDYTGGTITFDITENNQ
jgi:hypothetical protein